MDSTSQSEAQVERRESTEEICCLYILQCLSREYDSVTVSFKNSKHFGESSEIVLTMKMGWGGSFFLSICILLVFLDLGEGGILKLLILAIIVFLV